MIGKRIILLILVFAVIADLGYSFLQYYNYPIDGDVATHVLPEKNFERVLSDPIGVHALKTGKPYADPNRFFMHYPYFVIMNGLPELYRNFVDPIQAVYLSMATIKLFTHLCLLLLIVILTHGGVHWKRNSFWLLMFIGSAFFQANAHIERIGIIDPSITYVFGYAFQMIFVLFFFTPLILKYYHVFSMPLLDRVKWIWITFSFVICFGSPLTPGIILVVCFMIGVYFIARALKEGLDLRGMLRLIPKDVFIYLFPASIFALFSLYIGTFNSNTLFYADQSTISEAYQNLPFGILNQFILNKGYLVLIVVAVISFSLIAKFDNEEVKKFKISVFLIVLFSLIYLLLLPLGGYKPYRPFTLRYDTVLPITLGFIFIILQSILLYLRHGRSQKKYGQKLFLLMLISALFAVDKPEFEKNDLEQNALYKMSKSSCDTVLIEHRAATIMSWELIDSPEQSIIPGRMLQKWEITENPVLYYQEEME